MSAILRLPQTVVPETPLPQEEVRAVFAAQPDINRLAARIVNASFGASGIDMRYTAITELGTKEHVEDPMFYDREANLLLSPGTAARNELYVRAATGLFIEAARRALAASPDISTADITHLITVSCTGFHAPGPDFEIVQALGLRDGVERYHFGFMGCYASIPALRAARQFSLADPDAVVLVVSAELCTLHLRSSNDPDTIVASSLFADGAAAAIVSSRPPADGSVALALDSFGTAIAPDSIEHMAWTIGDHGFEMILSTAVPKVIEANVDDALASLCGPDDALSSAQGDGGIVEAVTHWAIHPGGRDILDRVQHQVGLTDAQLAPAREVLRTYGNMSSATILFVLNRILRESDPRDGERLIAMAFGPGLTMEGGVMSVLGGRRGDS
ncbi:MAG: type III polyketide synthase [Actinomycetota bacterium]